MDAKLLFFAAIGFYILGALFMRNTHPYSGSHHEPFESKQQRRLIGMILVSLASLLLGVGLLYQYLISKN